MTELMFLLVTGVVGAESLAYFAVSPQTIEQVVASCPKLPTLQEMESEVSRMISQGREKMPQRLHRFGRYRPALESYSLDGLLLPDFNPHDFEVISELTFHRKFKSLIFLDFYKLERVRVQGVQKIQRTCLWKSCIEEKTEKSDLSRFNASPVCSDALCVGKRIFGPEQGVRILWAYLKFGTNVSPFSDVNADPAGFNAETLEALLVAMTHVPEHLRSVALRDSGFFRFARGYGLPRYLGRGVIADANGAVFDPIDAETFHEKVGTFTHELGHRSSGAGEWDKSSEWKAATGWIVHGRESWNDRQDGWVSKYAKKNHFEDYAETYLSYRYTPQRLKQISPARYQFMKEHVFNQIEYDQDICIGKVNSTIPRAQTREATR